MNNLLYQTYRSLHKNGIVIYQVNVEILVLSLNLLVVLYTMALAKLYWTVIILKKVKIYVCILISDLYTYTNLLGSILNNYFLF